MSSESKTGVDDLTIQLQKAQYELVKAKKELIDLLKKAGAVVEFLKLNDNVPENINRIANVSSFDDLTEDLKKELIAASAVVLEDASPSSSSKRGGGLTGDDTYVRDVSNIGNLIDTTRPPAQYASSEQVNTLLSTPQASSASLRLSDNTAFVLSGNNYELVDPPLRGGSGPEKKKKGKPKSGSKKT